MVFTAEYNMLASISLIPVCQISSFSSIIKWVRSPSTHKTFKYPYNWKSVGSSLQTVRAKKLPTLTYWRPSGLQWKYPAGMWTNLKTLFPQNVILNSVCHSMKRGLFFCAFNSFSRQNFHNAIVLDSSRL